MPVPGGAALTGATGVIHFTPVVSQHRGRLTSIQSARAATFSSPAGRAASGYIQRAGHHRIRDAVDKAILLQRLRRCASIFS